MLDGQVVDAIDDELNPGEPIEIHPFELTSNFPFSGLGIKLSPSNREISYATYLSGVAVAPELKEFFVPAIGGENLYDLVDFRLAPHAIAPEKLRAFIAGGGNLSANGLIPISSPDAYAHSAPAAAICRAVSLYQYAFACGETSSFLRFTLVPKKDFILKHKLVVFPADSFGLFAVLQSDVHSTWAWRWGLRRETRLVYSPKRCATTFPMPTCPDELSVIAEKYYLFRQSIIEARGEGLTRIYTHFHDSNEDATDICQLRSLHIEMDEAIADSYGWHDLDLGHGFHETKQGIRFTISEAARREVLDRLLALNHQRHAEEAAAAAAQAAKRPAKKLGRKKQGSVGQSALDL
ncbi:hypothetical protein [Castellaniella sp. GW247-6E4]|uniref:hypothetical protein n=1 Tax=Castellaniella sp. GW247-6E4 TaxID=3140380 RepID=UPI0033145104